MFYYEDKDGSFEKLIRDYVCASRNGGYEIGKGWPHFSLSELTEAKGLGGLEYGFSPIIEAASTDNGIGETGLFESEMNYMKSLTGEISLKILPAINEVLDEYDYEGSPIFGDTMDAGLLSELVEKSMQHAALLIKDIKDIMLEARTGPLDRRSLLQSIFEGVVLKEVFAVRRYHHRQVLGQEFCYGE